MDQKNKDDAPDLCVTYDTTGTITKIVDGSGQATLVSFLGQQLLNLFSIRHRGLVRDAQTKQVPAHSIGLTDFPEQTFTLEFHELNDTRQVYVYNEAIADKHQTASSNRLETAYRQALRRLDVLADSIPLGIAVVHIPTRLVIRANEPLLEMFGAAADQHHAISLEEIVVGFSPEQFAARVQSIQSHGRITFEQTLKFGGREQRSRLTVSKEYDPDVLIIAVENIADEAKRRNAMSQLMRTLSTTQGASLYETLSLGLADIFALDAIGVIEHVNDGQSGQTLCWVADGEVLPNFQYELAGTPCLDLRQRDEVIWTHGLQEAFPDDAELLDFNARSYIGIALTDTDGRRFGHIACMHRTELFEADDILTQLRLFSPFVLGELVRSRMQEEMDIVHQSMQRRQKLESLGMLAGGIAHDFNNLLASILGNTELAEIKRAEHADYQGHLSQIQSSSLQAADLCKQLLAYAGRGRYVVKNYNANDIITEMSKILEVSISKHANLVLEFDQDIAPIRVDRAQFSQLVLNLVANASDAITEQGGQISVRTEMLYCDDLHLARHRVEGLNMGTYVIIEVTDNGTGMDPTTQQNMFDPFFSTKDDARGLGLAAAIGIVHGHEGAIAVDSKFNQGTRIRVYLPAQLDAEFEQPRSESHNYDLSGLSVLVVDDEETVRTTCQAMLANLGAIVTVAHDGNVALESLAQPTPLPDVVLLDLTMPNLDGKETLSGIRSNWPQLPVVMMSGYGDQDVTQQLTGQAFNGFVQKPFAINTLAAALLEHVGEQQA